MGNRILATCTAILYSQITGRRLIVDWRDGSYSENALNSFPQFFNCPHLGQIEEILQTNSVYPALWSGRLNQSFGSLRHELDISDQAMSFDVSKGNYTEDILVFCSYTHRINRMKALFVGDFQYLLKLDYPEIIRSILESHLHLKEEIKQSIQQFKSNNFGTRTVGVHVRHTDMKIPVDKIIEATQRVVNRYKSDCIFLATDAQEMIEIFRNQFPNVSTAPKWFPPSGERMHQNWDNCPDKIQNGIEALTDLYLLAECQDLVFSSQSSFGYVSSVLSKAGSGHLHNVNTNPLPAKLRTRATQFLAKFGL
jgi:hypothetical protein